MEELVKNYVVENLGRIFPRIKLIERNKMLPGGRYVDLHLVNKRGEHIFIEIKSSQIKRSQVGQILNYYSAISNIDPPLKNFKLVVIGKSVDRSIKDILNKLDIVFIPLSELDVSRETFKRILQERLKYKSRMLTPIEAELVSEWKANNNNTVTIGDVARKLKLKRNYARAIVNRLESKKWLERIKRGVYLFIPIEYGYEERYPPMDPLLVGSVLIEPYYYSYATSNAHYGFTTQIRPTVYIASTKGKKDFKWRDNRFKFVTLTKSKFFGYHEVEIQGTKVSIAEPEKSIVDSIDKVKYAGGIEEAAGVVYNGLKKIDCKKLVDYAIRLNSYSTIQRLGFLIDFLANEASIRFLSRERKRLLKHVGKTTVYLAPTKRYGRKGKFKKNWNIVQNVSKEKLLSEILIK